VDTVTVNVRVGSLTGTNVGNFIVHARALRPGLTVSSGGAPFIVQEVVWLGTPPPGPLAIAAVVVVAP
jgi:hypothetical protein